ncbi:ABC transporter ATP-binding protein [Brevibacillus sp. SYP-B805]|uniref:ABC transporter ATP-binding protein n=1 Tax=Brevibacillus sp. SYP-B805 TaxID=1578199 RepID=UPI0013EB754B|nr:ABC transporter ATP-binding protein [Brevibacillus sp. SYP-B805]NGQ93841.1 ABC transporter ATP-binding protein [Brevibacillus sp. SYP-B805]
MMAWPQKPMSVGQILDRTFSVYRKHFGKLFLLTLILFAPLYLIQEVALNDAGNMPFWPTFDTDVPFSERFLESYSESGEEPSVGLLILFFVVALLTGLVSTPISMAAVVFMVQSVMRGETVELGKALKQSFRRYWPLLGSCLVYGLIVFLMCIGFFMVLMLVIFGVAAIGSGGDESIQQFFANPLSALLGGVSVLLFFLVLLVPFCYFLLRWGFFLPAVAVEKVAPGIDKSWKLTKGNFWRILGVYLVMMTIAVVFTMMIELLVLVSLGQSILGLLVQNLLTLMLMPLSSVAYAVTFFDLRIRTEGTDLEALLAEPAREHAAGEPEATNE